MCMNEQNFKQVISEDEAMVRLLPLIDDVAIIVYDSDTTDCCQALKKYMDEINLDESCIKRIILVGNNIKDVRNESVLDLFPEAHWTILGKDWKETSFSRLKIRNTLVIHIATCVNIGDFKTKRGDGLLLQERVKETRSAYYACFLWKQSDDLFANHVCLYSHMSLEDYKLEEEPYIEPSVFCKKREEFISLCLKELTQKDVFFQIMEEVTNGCTECNLCIKYGRAHLCPMAQHYIAKFYREGFFVPQNDSIAHQWEIAAARQGYKPAVLQVADDNVLGKGCDIDEEKAFSLYQKYAYTRGNGSCLEKILSLVENSTKITPVAAVPYIAMYAQECADETIRLCDAFHHAKYGLPIDAVQEWAWRRKGANMNIPSLMKNMAEFCEDKEEWKEAYKWYKKLQRIQPMSVDLKKFDVLEIKMITQKSDSSDIAMIGRDYLYGYHQKEMDTKLAFRCLAYAEKNGDIMASGLIGQMLFDGIELQQDKSHGYMLMTTAAEKGDLMSLERLLRLHVEGVEYLNDLQHYKELYKVAIDDGVKSNIPYACYLKGCCLQKGIFDEVDEKKAFFFMKMAADEEIPEAQYELALMYQYGLGVEADHYAFFSYLGQAASNGYLDAIALLGKCYSNDPYWKHQKRTFDLLNYAYNHGRNDVEWQLAVAYMNGYGTDICEEKAYPLYQKAAEEGNADAQIALCKCYFRENSFLGRNYKLCAQWGEQAILQGIKEVRFQTAYASLEIGKDERAKELYLELADEGNAAAMNNYACSLSDPEEKAIWFEKAANNGDSFGYWNLGNLYKDGRGVKQDYSKALSLFKQAASMGNKHAMMEIANMYRFGKGIELDKEKAMDWLNKAMIAGDEQAKMELAYWLITDGQKKDQSLGLKYYMELAQDGNEDALYNLGEFYENIVNDIKHAIFWYRKGALKKELRCIDALKRLDMNWLDEHGVQDVKI